MEIGAFALRDIILVGAVLGGIYVVVMLLRLAHVGRRKRLNVDVTATVADDIPVPAAEAEAVKEEAFVPPPAPRPVPPLAEVVDFGAELQRTQLEREVKELREVVAALRDEIEGLKAANRVSPQYADAMALAQRGLSAMDVAARCDISLGEAELVWALAHGPGRFDQEEDYGGDSRSIPARTG